MSTCMEVKVGDDMAVITKGAFTSSMSIARMKVVRVTKTTFALGDGTVYSIATGNSRGNHSSYHISAEPWTERHAAKASKLEADARLRRLRQTLRDASWHRCDEATLLQIIAILKTVEGAI